MAMPEKKFGEIRNQLPAKDWVALVGDDQPVRLVDFPWGAPLPKSGAGALGAGEIGVILTGEAEVCEEHWLSPWGPEDKNEVYACPCGYRPIRHLEVGDIFGDFSLLDEAVFSKSVVSRPFERWNVVFGGRSAIFLGNGTGRPEQSFFEDEHNKRAIHHLLDRAMDKHRTSVAYIRWRPNDDLEGFLKGIFPSSWKRAYTYRLASNSYNVRHKFVFLGRARKALRAHRNKAGTKPKHQYSDRVNFAEIAPAFVEAIYDALNRPIRDEPVFARCSLESEDRDLQTVLKSGDIGRPTRISRHPEISEFFFPIGLSNFLVCNYANATQQMEEFYKGISVKSCKGPVPSTGGREWHPTTGGAKGTGLHFWQKAAELVIESHVTINTESDERDGFARSGIESQYNLSCEVIPSFDGRLELYVKYART